MQQLLRYLPTLVAPERDLSRGGNSMKRNSGFLAVFSIGLALSLSSAGMRAQQLIIKGQYGMMAGTMPPPGFYAGMWGDIDWATELKTGTGDTIPGPKLTEEVFGPLLMW